MEELAEFIQSNPDPRELKRALAVQMVSQNYTYFEIQDILQVSVGFISKWRKTFEAQGVSGLVLHHQGSSGYLSTQQRQSVIDWLQQKNYWNLRELQQHVEDTYEVVFASNQSYYDLFSEAGISWKKTQKCNPKTDPELVEKKTGDHDLAGAASSGDCQRTIGCVLSG
jgi:putative transposase